LTHPVAPRFDPPGSKLEIAALALWAGGRVLKTEQWMDIQLLFKQLGSIRAVVRQTGYSRNTVRKM